MNNKMIEARGKYSKKVNMFGKRKNFRNSQNLTADCSVADKRRSKNREKV